MAVSKLKPSSEHLQVLKRSLTIKQFAYQTILKDGIQMQRSRWKVLQGKTPDTRKVYHSRLQRLVYKANWAEQQAKVAQVVLPSSITACFGRICCKCTTYSHFCQWWRLLCIENISQQKKINVECCVTLLSLNKMGTDSKPAPMASGPM